MSRYALIARFSITSRVLLFSLFFSPGTVLGAGDLGGMGVPHLDLRGFSDFSYTLHSEGDDSENAFFLGAVDLFISSQVSNKLTFISEMVFEIEVDENEIEFELERVNLGYWFSDGISVRAGRIHTPMGYWNEAFHHGSWLQSSIERPLIYRFEDDGGILPIHSVGIDFFGTKVLDRFDFTYNLGIVNGRGRTKEEVQVGKDFNDSKAFNVLIRVRPHFIEGFSIGAYLYLDEIPSSLKMDEQILGGHITYLSRGIELLGEVFSIIHEVETSRVEYKTLGYYVQGAYQVDQFTPYYRLDILDIDPDDPYFSPSNEKSQTHTLGIRWDLLAWNAIRGEYAVTHYRDQADETLFVINTSFTF